MVAIFYKESIADLVEQRWRKPNSLRTCQGYSGPSLLEGVVLRPKGEIKIVHPTGGSHDLLDRNLAESLRYYGLFSDS